MTKNTKEIVKTNVHKYINDYIMVLFEQTNTYFIHNRYHIVQKSIYLCEKLFIKHTIQ